MKEILKLGLILFIITAVSGGLLGFAYEITKEPIAEQVRLANEEAMVKSFPQGEKFKKIEAEIPEDSNVVEIHAVYKGNVLEGFVVKVLSKGFGGPIEMTVGVSKDGMVQGVSILGHSETPGLGAKAQEDDFLSRYQGKSGILTVVKTGASKDNEIEAISGATITSKAVTDGINEVLDFIENHLDADNF
ncbi:MAG TPA: RnfABCDGE type electron transport complex subunit G [Defluviitaleaceae bacterium]|jgi:electron transport complex protein RnfG|nr:RnfABCDGE type electron transport complex subunit G [Candidatus Epulonipiscium sp.]HOQ16112.1 RnfABCDGE type electron transport complex subunit G [Defluviitaleaceae bacterium]HPT75438.1 RnfABCDGE type electron transport complex subunit G [Defluviitaleaceae bacterium]HQD49994.1 RnfABCDGE type electron transport complex subunit G [Defluviitaleaceae bacterium]